MADDRDEAPEGTRTYALRRLPLTDGGMNLHDVVRTVPLEVPVAIEFGGIGYAVMMTTPIDLPDFIAGFAISEGLASPDEIETPAIVRHGGGWIARMPIPARSTERVAQRARTRLSESGCGLCGMDSIAAVLAPLPPLTARPGGDAAAVAQALASLGERQTLGRASGATHVAALCRGDGRIVMAREDVGRHNALDKLIGAAAAADHGFADHFVLMSSRCSQELVEKCVRAGIPALVTISAPTSFAVDRAREAGLTLLCLARRDSALVANDPLGLFAP